MFATRPLRQAGSFGRPLSRPLRHMRSFSRWPTVVSTQGVFRFQGAGLRSPLPGLTFPSLPFDGTIITPYNDICNIICSFFAAFLFASLYIRDTASPGGSIQAQAWMWLPPSAPQNKKRLDYNAIWCYHIYATKLQEAMSVWQPFQRRRATRF